MELLNRSGKLEQASFFFKEEKRKVEFPFQALGIEMQDHFGKEYGKRIWPLFYRYPLGKLMDAWVAYNKGKVKEFNYFMGILLKI